MEGDLATELSEKLETIDVNDLLPYANNPKEHPEEQVKKIADSIHEYGYTVPIIVDADNRIIAGHGRYQAIQEYTGIKDVAVIRRDDMTEAQVKAFRVADNKIAESTWELESLGTELEQLAEQDEINMELTGFNDDELDAFIDDIETDGPPAPRDAYDDAGMPEYENENKTPEYSLKVNFRNEEDLQLFNECVESKVTTDTPSIWFPKQEHRDVKDMDWENDAE